MNKWLFLIYTADTDISQNTTIIIKLKISDQYTSFASWYILSQTPNATQNEAEFDRNKFSRRTKMINISQQQPINILKQKIFVCQLEFTELCSDWSKSYFRNFSCFLYVYKSSLCILSLCDVCPFS